MTDRPGEDARAHPIARRLEPGEDIKGLVHATEAQLLVTDRRVAVAQRDLVRLDVPFDRLRRIQFDIERDRPATLVIVPEHPRDEPQVLAIPREHIDAAANVLAFIGGLLLHPMDESREA